MQAQPALTLTHFGPDIINEPSDSPEHYDFVTFLRPIECGWTTTLLRNARTTR